MELNSILQKIEVAEPIAILKKIVTSNKLAIEQDNTELISVSVSQSNGFQIIGKPIKLDENGNSVLISNSNSILYCQLHHITSLQVTKPELVWDILTNGAYFTIPKEDMPTSFQLKKNWAELEECCKKSYDFILHQNILKAAELTDLIKHQMQQLILVLKQTFASISKDDIGLETLQLLDKVIIEDGEKELMVSLENENKLIIQMNLNKKFKSNLADELQKQIESKF
ncbi:hypothetical protein ACWGOQ_0022610 [Aquimarina sp. M1]